LELVWKRCWPASNIDEASKLAHVDYKDWCRAK
jgi:hypothetical protein